VFCEAPWRKWGSFVSHVAEDSRPFDLGLRFRVNSENELR
jgi:hypothetical protein